MKRNLNYNEVKDMLNNLDFIKKLKKVVSSKEYIEFAETKSFERSIELWEMFNAKIGSNEYGQPLLIDTMKKHFQRNSLMLNRYVRLEMNLSEAVNMWYLLDKLGGYILRNLLPMSNKIIVKYFQKYEVITEEDSKFIRETARDYSNSFSDNKQKKLEFKKFRVKYEQAMKNILKDKEVNALTGEEIYNGIHLKEEYKGCFDYYYETWVQELEMEAIEKFYSELREEDEEFEGKDFGDFISCDYIITCIRNTKESEIDVVGYIGQQTAHDEPMSEEIDSNLYINIPYWSTSEIAIHFYIELLLRNVK